MTVQLSEYLNSVLDTEQRREMQTVFEKLLYNKDCSHQAIVLSEAMTTGITLSGAMTTGITMTGEMTNYINFGSVGTTSSVALHFVSAFLGHSIETGTYQSTADGGVILDSTNTFNAGFLADDSGADIGCSVRNVLARTLLTVSQSEGSIRSLMGQLKLLNGVDLETGVYTGIQGYMEIVGDTDVGSGGKVSCIDISVEIASAKTLTIDSGGVFAGLKIETTGAGTISNSGDCAAIYIDDGGTVTDWPVGVDIQNCAIGLDVGACSSKGLYISGACAYGIDIGGEATTMAIRAIGQTVEIGQLLSTMTLDSADRNAFSVTAISPANAAHELRAIHAHTYPCTVDQATSRMVAIYAQASSQFSVYSLKGVYGYANCAAAETLAESSAGVHADVNVDFATTVTSGHLAALWAQVRGDSILTGSLYGIAVDLDMDVDVGIDLDVASAKTVGIGLKMTANGTITCGIELPTCATGINFTGAYATSGINFSSATFPVASDNVSFINIGTYDTPVSVGALSDNSFGVMNNLKSTADDAFWFMNEYMKIAVDTADQTSKSICNLAIRQNIAKPISATYGIQAHLTFATTGDTSSEVVALSAQINGTHAGSGLHWGVKSDLRHAGCPSGAGHLSACFFGVGTVDCSCGVYIEALSTKTIYSGIYLHGAGTITNAIEIAGTATYFLDLTNADEGGTKCFDKGNEATSIVGVLRIKDTDGSAAYINVWSTAGGQ